MMRRGLFGRKKHRMSQGKNIRKYERRQKKKGFDHG